MTITVEGPGGATVEFPDGTSADTIHKAMSDHFGGGKKEEASGVIAGVAHGLAEPVEGLKETAKRFAGVGPGRKEDPNYVPANVTNGSWNPANWNVSQIPQKVAEMAPDVGAGALAATAGKALARGGVKGKLLGAMIGAGLYGTARSAGDTAKEVTVARTGDENAPSSTADLVRGGLTAAASSVPDAVLPTRFVPGLSKAVGPGAAGVGQAALRQLNTTALGGAGAVASDAIQQVGTTVGTDKGLTIDPSRFPEAAVGGAATGAVMGAPKAAADTIRATSLREHGGANLEATKNYATRLNEEGQGKLGDKLSGAGHFDQTAHDNTVFGIQRELSDAGRNVRKQISLSPEADNILAKAESNKKLHANEINLLDRELAGAPDGANAAYLARTMRMSQLAAERGQNGGKAGWTGGISGVADANIGYMLNPMRAATGAVMSGFGANLLGAGSPMFAGTALGLYGAARLIDGAAGTRSPAKTFAEHFADSSAKLRLPTSQPPAAPAAPPTASPWGPRPPMSGPTGPAVAPPGAPTTPQGPQGPWGPRPGLGINPTGPVAGSRQGPPAPPPAPAAPQPSINPMALMMLKQKLKAGLPPAPPEPTPEAPKAPWATPRVREEWKTPNVSDPVMPALDSLVKPTPTEVPNDALVKAKRLMAGLKNVQKLKANALAPTGEPASLGAAAAPVTADVTAPKTMADVLRNAELRASLAPKPKTIKKVAGKIQEEAPKAPEPPKAAAYEPFDPEGDPRERYPRGLSARAYGEAEAARKGKSDNERYIGNATKTAADWIRTTNLLSSKYKGYRPSFESTLHHLINIGSNVETRRAAIEHFASHVPPDIAAEMRERYK